MVLAIGLFAALDLLVAGMLVEPSLKKVRRRMLMRAADKAVSRFRAVDRAFAPFPFEDDPGLP